MQQGSAAQTALLAGGTTLIDLMKLDVMTPTRLVDINSLPLSKIETGPNGVRIGAMVRNSDLAHNEMIKRDYPVLSQALLSGASPQLRNMATTGGNLMQRTRCYYFRDTAYACNKRNPGSGCAAMEGFNRIHAILGGSDKCIAVHPSDMAVAMLALDATVQIQSSGGTRDVALKDLHLLPGETPQHETVVKPGDLILSVTLPGKASAKKSAYVKLRDRASYEFALASCAAVLHMDGDTIKQAGIALGGVATKPWRSTEAEQALAGKRASEQTFQAAAEAALQSAKPLKYNAYKIPLAKMAIVRALKEASAVKG
jgi:xanthine dehydrogenase YagS FAD-binding subunit